MGCISTPAAALLALLAVATPALGFSPAGALLRPVGQGRAPLSRLSPLLPRASGMRRGALCGLRASEGGGESDEEKRRAAEEEAKKWKEEAARLEEKRSMGVKDGPAPLKDAPIKSMYDASGGQEGDKLPEVSSGEIDSLMARAEAFKAKQQAAASKMAAAASDAYGVSEKVNDDEMPERFKPASAKKKKLTPAAPLVGGDAGSLRQAAPYEPGTSKAGAIQEGWTEDQIERMLEEEAKFKEQLAEKKKEEEMASALVGDAAAGMFQITPEMKSEKGIPSSMENAVVQALLSSVDVMRRGCGKFRIDVDVSKDETYTTLKNSIPFTRVYAKGLVVNGFSKLRIILPDPGAAALATRDWAGADGHNVVAFERFRDTPVDDDDDAVVVVAAAASEIDKIRKLSETAGEKGIPVILINPSVKSPGGENLGSLGAFSLGLTDFLNTFETAYMLRSVPYGIVHRQYPSKYSVYEEVPRGFDKLAEVPNFPSGLELEEMYQEAHPEDKVDGIEGVAKGVGRFIRNYSKG